MSARAALVRVLMALLAYSTGVAFAETKLESDLFHTLQRNAWYYQSNDRTASIHVTSLGKGPKVVVLHGGFGANFEYMVSAVERHANQRQFILYDQRGSLLSPYKGKLEELGVDDLVDDLEKLRIELGEERLALLAHSMGTRLAYEYVRKYPDRVASLVLVGAFPPINTTNGFDEAINQRGHALLDRPEVKAQLAREGLDGVTETSPARLQSMQWRLRFASVNMVRVERWRVMEGGKAYYNGEAGSRLAQSAPPTWDVPAFLGARRIPISVIQGDQDYVDPNASQWTQLQKQGGPLAACIRIKVVERAGHATWLDDPDVFQAALDTALARQGC